MKKNLLLLVAICLLAACTKSTPQYLEMPSWARNNAMPVTLNDENMIGKDSFLLYINDYFPALDGVDSVVVNDGYHATVNGDGTLTLTRQGEQKHYAVMRFHRGSEHADVAITPAIDMHVNLFTTAATENSFSFRTINDGHYTFCYFIDNENIELKDFAPDDNGTYSLPIPPLSKGRHFARVFATDGTSRTNDLLIPLEGSKPVTDAAQLTRHDHEAQVLYSLMIDRFCNGNTANDQPLNSPEVLPIVDYMGGDIKGVTQKIQEGFFDSLGINTIWISPVTQNPLDAWGYYPFKKNADGTYNNKYDPTKAYTKFSGYHGYWPIYTTRLDHRFATDAEMREMLDVAHKHDINVILDYVANHVHINSPTLREHPDWVTDSIAPDGLPNFERWDDFRLTTWFDKHIPTLDLERAEVCDNMTDSALYWIANYDLDGFRHDACKHIPLQYWRMFGHKMAQRFPERDLWMIGETYGSEALIGSYVKTGMLNAQFDFNIYHTAIDALAQRPGHSMKDILDQVLSSQQAYGAHHTMGNISGNHDKARFISLAGGALQWDEDPYKEAGWTRNVTVADSAKGYQRSLLLEVLNLTIPGVPCIYQGDEYAETGANDPDNRHMMRFEGYNSYEQIHRQWVKDIIKLRHANLALTYGEFIPLMESEEVIAYMRKYMDQVVIVVLNNSMQRFETDIYVPPFTLPHNIDKVFVSVGPMDNQLIII